MPIRPFDKPLSYADAALALSVSKASILNWIKSGELQSGPRGYVCAHSLECFKKKIAGQTRLNARANKLHRKPSKPASFALARPLKAPLERTPVQNGEAQSSAYENELGNVRQNKDGIYYTPAFIIDAMLAKIPGDVSNLKFLDPCCGTGNFLLGALRRGFKPHNIFGHDCDSDALGIAKARMENMTGQNYNTLSHCDFLNLSPETMTNLYDVIATNPPWGKKYTFDEKIKRAKTFGLKASIGSSALFSLQAIERVKDGGYVALLLPESCSNIAAFEPLRKRFLEQHILALEDHGRVFNGLMTRAHSILLRKNVAPPPQSIPCSTEGQLYERSRSSFTKQPKSIFNFATRPEEMDIIEHLRGHPHITLQDNASWGIGIVTGHNKTLCRHSPIEGDVTVYRGSDITKTALKTPKLYLNPDLTLYRQVAPHTLYHAKEKLIYKFISNRLVFYHDTEQRLILNSANMLVLNDNFPLTQSQLCFLLNTELMNFIFQKTFATRKVLRSDLETLPIFHTFFTSSIKPTEKNLLTHLGLIKKEVGYAIATLQV